MMVYAMYRSFHSIMKILRVFLFLVSSQAVDCWLFARDDQANLDEALLSKLQLRRTVFGNGVISYGSKNDNVRQRRGMWWDEPDIETAISMTLVTCSGLTSNNTVTLTVSTLYTLNKLWLIRTDQRTIMTKGDLRKDGIIMYSAITLTEEELGQTNKLEVIVNAPEYTYILDFDLDMIPKKHKNAKVNLNSYLFDGPHYPDRMSGGSYEFKLYTPDGMETPREYLSFSHMYIDTEQNVPVLRMNPVEVEFDVAYDGIKVKARLPESAKPGESLYVSFGNVNAYGLYPAASLFAINAVRYINIPRPQPSSNTDLLVFAPDLEGTSRFPNNIRYGSLGCAAFGKPVPTIEISQDGNVLDSTSFSTLNISSAAYVSLDGQMLGDVSGRYLCKASIGDAHIEKEILVEEL